MRTPTAKRILLLIVTVTVLLGLVAWIMHQPSLSVTVLNPKFRLLNAKLSHGTKHELAKDSWTVTQWSKLLHLVDARVVVPIQLPPMPENSYALAVRFTGDFAPNALSGVKAELVEASGTVTLLWSPAGYVSGKNILSEYGRIWLLESPPTNSVTIRLRPGIGQASLVEFRIRSD